MSDSFASGAARGASFSTGRGASPPANVASARMPAGGELPDAAAPQPAGQRGGRRAFSLTRWFAVLGLLCIGATSVLTSVFLSRFLTDRMLQHDAGVIMEVVQSIAEVQGTSGYFLGTGSPDGRRSLEEFVSHVGRLPDVIRANIYAKDQSVLWSTDPSLIGKRLGPNHELEEALEGHIAIETGTVGDSADAKPEHLRLRSDEPRFVESYLPVRMKAGGEVIGAVEVYRVPTTLFQAIGEGIRMIWLCAAAGGVFLYLALFWIVRTADRTIAEQSERLLESETLAVIGEMTGAITHGIRNPLASIRTSAELCQEDPSPHVRESARDIMAEVDRLSGWVRQLLTYSDSEPARAEAVDLAALLRGCLEGYEREMQRRGVRLEAALDGAYPRVRGESVRLTHAFNSLLANAFEAMPHGGRLALTLDAAPRERGVRVTLRDTGAGIPKDQLGRIFAPFFTTKRKGLGLGLPLVRRIVNRYDGTIAVASEPGQGTEVVVVLKEVAN